MSLFLNNADVATLGLTNWTRSLSSLAGDNVTFTAKRNVDVAKVVGYGTTATIKLNDRQIFSGRVSKPTLTGSSRTETHRYEIVGGLWYLEHLPYLAGWRRRVWNANLNGGDWQYTDDNCSRVILGQNTDGTPMSVGGQVRAILTYAIGVGANLRIGQIPAGTTFPWEEATDLTCMEAILRVLRWAPDWLSGVDYSTTPPTINFYSALPPATCPALNLPAVEFTPLEFTPRYDLQAPGVLLIYESSNTVDGNTSVDAVKDSAGTLGLNAVVHTLQLSGSTINNTKQTQHVKIENPGAWFKTHAAVGVSSWWFQCNVPELAASHIVLGSLQVSNLQFEVADKASGDPLLLLPYRLVEGTIQEWMIDGSEGYNIKVQAQTLSFDVQYKVLHPVWGTDLIKRKMFMTVTATDCAHGNYIEHIDGTITENNPIAPGAIVGRTYIHQTSSVSGGEPVPQGLAAALYAALQRLHYDGRLARMDAECPCAYLPGSLLNVTGGAPEWAAMNTCLQQVREDLDHGYTELVCGHPGHLETGDLIDRLRANRCRLPPRRHAERLSGNPSDSAPTIALGSQIPRLEVTSRDNPEYVEVTFVVDERYDEPTMGFSQRKASAKFLLRDLVDLGWAEVFTAVLCPAADQGTQAGT